MPDGVDDRDADVWEAAARRGRRRGRGVAAARPRSGRSACSGFQGEHAEPRHPAPRRPAHRLRRERGDGDRRRCSPALYELDEAPWAELVGGNRSTRVGWPNGSDRTASNRRTSASARPSRRATPAKTSRTPGRGICHRPRPPRNPLHPLHRPPRSPRTQRTPLRGRRPRRRHDAVRSTGGEEENPATTGDASADGEAPDPDVADVADFWGDGGASVDGGSHVAAEDRAESAEASTRARVCIECGVALPAGWNVSYCDRHCGVADEGDDQTPIPPSPPPLPNVWA